MTEERTAIICAMEEELAPFKKLGDKRLLLIRSGVGKVNAAIAAMDAIHQGATRVIVAGVAGGIDPEVVRTDVVIANHAIQHDMDVTALGFKPSEIPFAAVSRWKADPQLVEDLYRVCLKLKRSVHIGRILTGDRFVASRKAASELRESFAGLCLDMETAAVAQTCHAKNIPWVAVRIISDTADEASPTSFPRFLAESARMTATIVNTLIESEDAMNRSERELDASGILNATAGESWVSVADNLARIPQEDFEKLMTAFRLYRDAHPEKGALLAAG